jgi:hypothetical protein
MTNHRICNNSNTTCVTSGTRTAYSSGAHEFILGVFVGFLLLFLMAFVQCFVNHCLSFFGWPLYCLSFLDLRLLITDVIMYLMSTIWFVFYYYFIVFLLFEGDIVVVIVRYWIYNYLCKQCLSPLKLLVRTPVHGEVYSIQLVYNKTLTKIHCWGGAM